MSDSANSNFNHKLSRRAFLSGGAVCLSLAATSSHADIQWNNSPILHAPDGPERLIPVVPDEILYNKSKLPARDRVHANLILCMDSSLSMRQEGHPDNFSLQLKGTAAALESYDVISVIKRHQGIAITVLQFSGMAVQTIPWTFIENEKDAFDFADLIRAQAMLGRSTTSIVAGLILCEQLMRGAPYRADNMVVDVSGDGKNSGGPTKPYTRSLAEKFNTRVNAIAICDKVPDLDGYFKRELVTDQKIFNETGVSVGNTWRVASMEDFPAIMRQKLVEEIAGGGPPRPRFG
jgi:hypothetical protein